MKLSVLGLVFVFAFACIVANVSGAVTVPWEKPGGSSNGNIATLVLYNQIESYGTTFMVVRGTDNHLYFNKYETSGGGSSFDHWAGWTSLGGTTNDDPVIAYTDDYFVVVIRGSDNHLYAKKLNFDTGAWDASWTSLGGTTTSTPAITAAYRGGIYAGNRRVTVAIRGSDNHVYTKSMYVDTWGSSWANEGGTTVDSPAIAYRWTGTPTEFTEYTTLAVRGSDNKVYTKTSTTTCDSDPPPGDCSGWGGPWTLAGGSTLSSPVILYKNGVLHIFIRGTDNHVYHKAGASPYDSMGGTTAARPTVYTYQNTDFIEVSIRGSDNGVYHCIYRTEGVWTPWTHLGSSKSTLRPQFSSIGDGNSRLGVLGVVGTDNSVNVLDQRPQEIEQLIFQLSNERRASAGLPAYVWDNYAANEARRHSIDMANADAGSHDYPAGINAQNWAMMPSGSNVLFTLDCTGCSGCPTSTAWVDGRSSAVASYTVYMWMDVDFCSSANGHRDNILSNTLDELGVGAAMSSTHRWYSTQNFI